MLSKARMRGGSSKPSETGRGTGGAADCYQPHKRSSRTLRDAEPDPQLGKKSWRPAFPRQPPASCHRQRASRYSLSSAGSRLVKTRPVWLGPDKLSARQRSRSAQAPYRGCLTASDRPWAAVQGDTDHVFRCPGRPAQLHIGNCSLTTSVRNGSRPAASDLNHAVSIDARRHLIGRGGVMSVPEEFRV